MTCIYLTVIIADNDISMFILASHYVGLHITIIFDKMQNMPMCICYMVQNQMENLTVDTMNLMHTKTSVEFYMHTKL